MANVATDAIQESILQGLFILNIFFSEQEEVTCLCRDLVHLLHVS